MRLINSECAFKMTLYKHLQTSTHLPCSHINSYNNNKIGAKQLIYPYLFVYNLNIFALAYKQVKPVTPLSHVPDIALCSFKS